MWCHTIGIVLQLAVFIQQIVLDVFMSIHRVLFDSIPSGIPLTGIFHIMDKPCFIFAKSLLVVLYINSSVLLFQIILYQTSLEPIYKCYSRAIFYLNYDN